MTQEEWDSLRPGDVVLHVGGKVEREVQERHPDGAALFLGGECGSVPSLWELVRRAKEDPDPDGSEMECRSRHFAALVATRPIDEIRLPCPFHREDHARLCFEAKSTIHWIECPTAHFASLSFDSAELIELFRHWITLCDLAKAANAPDVDPDDDLKRPEGFYVENRPDEPGRPPDSRLADRQRLWWRSPAEWLAGSWSQDAAEEVPEPDPQGLEAEGIDPDTHARLSTALDDVVAGQAYGPEEFKRRARLFQETAAERFPDHPWVRVLFAGTIEATEDGGVRLEYDAPWDAVGVAEEDFKPVHGTYPKASEGWVKVGGKSTTWTFSRGPDSVTLDDGLQGHTVKVEPETCEPKLIQFNFEDAFGTAALYSELPLPEALRELRQKSDRPWLLQAVHYLRDRLSAETVYDYGLNWIEKDDPRTPEASE